MSDKSRFPRPNKHFPQFYSFVPDESERENYNELHYAVFGVNGPVYELRIYSTGEVDQFRTTMYSMWMEDRAVGLEDVTWEESAWSDHYFRGDNE